MSLLASATSSSTSTSRWLKLSLHSLSLVQSVRCIASSSSPSGSAHLTKFVQDILHSHDHLPGPKFNVHNPATGQVIGSVAAQTAEDANHLCKASMEAWVSWKDVLAKDRALYLTKMSELIKDHAHDLATIMTLESGKPHKEALGEVLYAKAFYDLYAEEAVRTQGEILQPNVRGRRILTYRQPVGPSALITPWNFPSAMVTRKVGPALAAGCTVVIKPSEETPFSTLALKRLSELAGLPKNVMNVLTVSRQDVQSVGSALCRHEDIRKVSFTGSTAVGKWLLKESADTVKKVSMELGGSAPFIVFDDADLEVAANALIAAKFRNNGQVCIASNRILVQSKVYDEFAALVSKKTAAMKVGNGLEDVALGPLINAQGLAKVSRHVEDCRAKGATITVGGEPIHELNAQGGTFYRPTVITGVTSDMLPFQEETFGPVAPLMKFETEEEAIRIANSTRYGLASYACTRNLARAFRVSEQLEFGMVGVNEGAISNAAAPFGGWKESGLGVEGGTYGIEEYLRVKYVCMGLGRD